MAKLQIVVLFSVSVLLTILVESTTALPHDLEHGLVINRRPEIYFDANVVDKAYRLCWMEIQKDILTGRAKRSGYPKWYPLAGGRRYFLPHSERQKLSLGENCLLMKGIEIVRNQERLMNEKLFGIQRETIDV
ncbi:unnamed protein product [Hymenolepis diminuta]|uniref:Uncharacterized protein n=1 Tax=Hymenolepis diminuta TaxID=6216 RepID=A0A0R3SAQ2_HYMDI|nr:unnamed protein product [Hymenolepis diminuta]VUZ55362.1 unnamed protein product [Hymenolepis diminuta]